MFELSCFGVRFHLRGKVANRKLQREWHRQPWCEISWCCGFACNKCGRLQSCPLRRSTCCATFRSALFRFSTLPWLSHSPQLSLFLSLSLSASNRPDPSTPAQIRPWSSRPRPSAGSIRPVWTVSWPGTPTVPGTLEPPPASISLKRPFNSTGKQPADAHLSDRETHKSQRPCRNC